jgi:UDP-perosamine 4-acetyltransferase
VYKNVVLLGSGGHAKVIIDILKTSDSFKLVGCTTAGNLKEIIGLPILGDDSILPELYKKGTKYAFIAIGDNRVRDERANYVKEIGFELINAISPFTYISKSAKLGTGIAVMAGAIIHTDAVIQDNVIVNTGSTIDHDCIIEESCHIAPGCNIAGNVRIGKGSFLGIGCKVVPKVSIGEWATVGSGAVVTKDLLGRITAVGIPARIIGTEEGQIK